MDNVHLFANILGTICFVIWVPAMILWIKAGVTIPRYVHVVAITMTLVSVFCLIGLIIGGLATWKLALGMTLVPLAGSYFGWFWMFGPEHVKAGGAGSVSVSENRQ